MDVVIASTVLIVTSPVMLATAIYIKLFSRGPAIYASQRVGYAGNEFTMFKFRTMAVGTSDKSHKEHMQSLIQSSDETDSAMSSQCMNKLDDDDARLIPMSSMIRKSCVDELPQLWNVLRGEMSLIGPRPAIPYELEAYHRWHHGRLNAVPGMTGLWQVSGKNRLSFREMVALDIRYAKEMTLLSDVGILARTPTAIVQQIGEYVDSRRSSHV